MKRLFLIFAAALVGSLALLTTAQNADAFWWPGGWDSPWNNWGGTPYYGGYPYGGYPYGGYPYGGYPYGGGYPAYGGYPHYGAPAHPAPYYAPAVPAPAPSDGTAKK